MGSFFQKKPFCGFCLCFLSYDIFDLDKFSKIPKIFHNFVLFYRILNYWNNVNERVVNEFFEVLDLEKHYVCRHF